jgi:hypothetical protein
MNIEAILCSNQVGKRPTLEGNTIIASLTATPDSSH